MSKTSQLIVLGAVPFQNFQGEITEIPEWFRIFTLGKQQMINNIVPEINVLAEDLPGIIQKVKARGLDPVIDYHHQTEMEGQMAPAAGWIKELEIREDGLWARAEWTPKGREHLQKKEYRYFSPVFFVDLETLRLVDFKNLALTNNPSFAGQTPLVAQSQDSAKAAQTARAKEFGIAVKRGGNVTKPREWESVPDDQWGDPVNYRYPMGDRAHAQNALSRWGDASNQAQYSQDERTIIENRIKRRAKALGIQISAERREAMKQGVMQLLAMQGEATDEAVLEALKMRLGPPAEFREIGELLVLKAEEVNWATIKGAILALKQGQAQDTKLGEEVLALKAEIAQGKAEAAVTQAIKDGKITPAQRDWALGYAKAEPEAFKTFVEKAPVIIPSAEPLKFPTKDGKGEVALTAEQAAMCHSANIKPEAFKASQTQLQEQGLLRGRG